MPLIEQFLARARTEVAPGDAKIIDPLSDAVLGPDDGVGVGGNVGMGGGVHCPGRFGGCPPFL